MSEIAELLERFRRGGELIAVVMTGAAGPELDYTPGEGKWSIRQILCHLADAEIVAVERFRRLLAEDNPTFIMFDQNAWAEKLDYHKRKASAVMETFRRIRGENHELLKDLPKEAFQRSGQHSKRGAITLLDILRVHAGHAENHARQIQSIRQQYKQSKSQ